MTPLEVLINKKKGTVLYSPCFGHVVLDRIDEYSNYIYVTNIKNTFCEAFLPNGRSKGEKDTEIMLFPSKDMRDWDKFSWEKGDILENINDDTEQVEFIEYKTFEKDYSGNYTTFKGKPINLKNHDCDVVCYYATEEFSYLGTIKNKKKFKPFDKILYVDKDTSTYQVDIVKYEDNGWLHTFYEPPIHINLAYPYKEEMAEFIGHKITEETEKKVKKILENG